MAEAKSRLAELVGQVAYGGKRFILQLIRTGGARLHLMCTPAWTKREQCRARWE